MLLLYLQEVVNETMKRGYSTHLVWFDMCCSQMRLEHLEEAGNEIMLADDDESARYLVGECWLHLGNETAEERLQTGAPAPPFCVDCRGDCWAPAWGDSTNIRPG